MKVSITRQISNIISPRWMDQGATQTTVMFRVPDRLTSGVVETLCKHHIADKTNWRTMLKGQPGSVDLHQVKQALLGSIENESNALKQEKAFRQLVKRMGQCMIFTSQ